MRVAILLLFFLLNGCFDQRAFEPPLPDYKLWKMSGMTDVDIKKIRLECGALSARDDGGLRTLKEPLNKVAQASEFINFTNQL